MINKQNLWFITLFSLILILGIYYVAIPQDIIATIAPENITETVSIEDEDSDIILAMKVEEEEKVLEEIESAKKTLLAQESTMAERNEAYDTLQLLNSKKSKVLELENLIKNSYNLESCIKINGNQINITLSSEDLGIEKANEIINTIQEKYENQMYITVSFKK